MIFIAAHDENVYVKLLRFGQDLSNGHFDAYLPTTAENNTQSRIEELVDEREHSPIASSVHSNISAKISLSQSSETDQSISSSLIKKRRRRARSTNYTRKNQMKKYRQNKAITY